MERGEIKIEVFQNIKEMAPGKNPSERDLNKNIHEFLNFGPYNPLQVVEAISERFNVRMTTEDYKNLHDLNSLVDYLEQKLRARHSGTTEGIP